MLSIFRVSLTYLVSVSIIRCCSISYSCSLLKATWCLWSNYIEWTIWDPSAYLIICCEYFSARALLLALHFVVVPWERLWYTELVFLFLLHLQSGIVRSMLLNLETPCFITSKNISNDKNIYWFTNSWFELLRCIPLFRSK